MAYERISRVLAWIAGALFLVSALLVTFDVLSRALFRRVVFESFEFSCYGFAIATALGFAYTVTTKANIRVDFANAYMPHRVRLAIDVLAAVVLAVFAIVFAWHAANVFWASWSMGARSNSALALPLKWPQGLWAAGIVWFALVATWVAIRVLAGAFARDWGAVDRLAGIRLTQDADATRESL